MSLPTWSPKDRIAEGIGRCGTCHSIIQKGERFQWAGEPPLPRCDTCLKKAAAKRVKR